MHSISRPNEKINLKCRGANCDYFGNAQWELYCSKCYREKVMRERIAECE
jgi:hypothetical protein